jgi:glucose-1-phosphate thymidylyltransferase
LTAKAVILARGLGTRMRKADPGAGLDPGQAQVADQGIKAMIPVGRPFLDYVLGGLADAGYDDILLVVGPEHQVIVDRYRRDLVPHRLRVSFAIQPEPRGTAHALLFAEAFTAGERFVVMNGDNYYPVEALAALRRLDEPALPAFSREALVADGIIPPERIARFALLDIGPDGYLRRIVEKPTEQEIASFGADPFVSMNCWNFGAEIFPACREAPASPRGEFEIPFAVGWAMDHLGLRLRALPFQLPVLDLSQRGDVAGVTRRLQGVTVRL